MRARAKKQWGKYKKKLWLKKVSHYFLLFKELFIPLFLLYLLFYDVPWVLVFWFCFFTLRRQILKVSLIWLKWVGKFLLLKCFQFCLASFPCHCKRAACKLQSACACVGHNDLMAGQKISMLVISAKGRMAAGKRGCALSHCWSCLPSYIYTDIYIYLRVTGL